MIRSHRNGMFPAFSIAFVAAFLGASMCAAVTADDRIKLRDGEADLVGSIEDVSGAGIVISISGGGNDDGDGDGDVALISWDRVRDYTFEDPSRQVVGLRLDAAERIWRGRLRVERGDLLLAEPLLRAAFSARGEGTDETSRVVAEGYLRCLLGRGDHVAALIPAFEVMRLERSGVTTPRYQDLPPIMDSESGLIMALAPAWHTNADLKNAHQRLSAYLREPLVGADVELSIMISFYLRAMESAVGRQEPAHELGPTPDADLAGRELPSAIRFLDDIDDANAGDIGAFETLIETRTRAPRWKTAWIDLICGRILLDADDPSTHQAAIVQLLAIPAGASDVVPYLAGTALGDARDWLNNAGRPDDAARIQTELNQRFPGHPMASLASSPPETS